LRNLEKAGSEGIWYFKDRADKALTQLAGKLDQLLQESEDYPEPYMALRTCLYKLRPHMDWNGVKPCILTFLDLPKGESALDVPSFVSRGPLKTKKVHEVKELEKGFLSKRNLRATGHLTKRRIRNNPPMAIQTFLGASVAGPT